MEAFVLTFQSLTRCSDRTAREYLSRHNWDINDALNVYYDSGHYDRDYDQDQSYPLELQQLFRTYAVDTPRGPVIDTDGLIRYIGDLGYGIDNLATICLAQLLQCRRLTDAITEGQFAFNWQQNGCTTQEEMRKVIRRLDHQLHANKDYMAEIYNYTFDLALDPGTKTLETHSAVQYWILFFATDQYPVMVEQQLFQLWLSFIQREASISKDSWRMLFLFFKRFSNLQLVKDNYNETDTWPYIIDEFYEYLIDEGKI